MGGNRPGLAGMRWTDPELERQSFGDPAVAPLVAGSLVVLCGAKTVTGD